MQSPLGIFCWDTKDWTSTYVDNDKIYSDSGNYEYKSLARTYALRIKFNVLLGLILSTIV